MLTSYSIVNQVPASGLYTLHESPSRPSQATKQLPGSVTAKAHQASAIVTETGRIVTVLTFIVTSVTTVTMGLQPIPLPPPTRKTHGIRSWKRKMDLAERIYRGRMAVDLARQRKLDTTTWEHHLKELLVDAGREPANDQGRHPWMLWEWRRLSIPQWREILQRSINHQDEAREDYARWMLRDILLDPDYTEPQK